MPHARAAALAAAVQAQPPAEAPAATASDAAGPAQASSFLSDLHRSPGPASARPGVFSSGGRSSTGLRRGGRAGAKTPVELDAGEEAEALGTPAPLPIVDTAAAWAQAESAVEELLDWLQAQRYLSEQRFAESRVHARAGRFGNLRIRQELAQHGVALDAEATQRLRDTELERCRAVWARKFGAEPPADAAARARQMRFLAGRGFSADVIRRVLQASED
ncbi:regulatory protein RecX [Azohydromonas caseinilytica]|nr:regulatory protein RecX [Azohydromonas caseinilytica]